MQTGESVQDGDKRRGDTSLVAGLGLLVGWKQPRFLEFLERFGPPTKWWDGNEPDFDGDEYDFLTKSQRQRLAQLYEDGPRALADRVDDWSGEVIAFDTPGMPAGLGELSRPPAALHIIGDSTAFGSAGLAVVGSRDIGVTAASTSRRILTSAISRGLVVVSGGARGSDAVAHRAAVDADGVTAVVLPSGLHNPSPKSNSRLFRDVVDSGGLVISEYPPDQGVRRYHFRRRNSLIAALSRGVLVLRAGHKSGTMITVRAARGLDRPLGAVPGDPDDPLAYGCLEILRDDGRMVATGQDLVDWWTELAPEQVVDPEEEEGDETEQLSLIASSDCEVLEAAVDLVDSEGAFGVEKLARRTGKSAAELQTVLLQHELSGALERIAGGSRFRFSDQISK